MQTAREEKKQADRHKRKQRIDKLECRHGGKGAKTDTGRQVSKRIGKLEGRQADKGTDRETGTEANKKNTGKE